MRRVRDAVEAFSYVELWVLVCGWFCLLSNGNRMPLIHTLTGSVCIYLWCFCCAACRMLSQCRWEAACAGLSCLTWGATLLASLA